MFESLLGFWLSTLLESLTYIYKIRWLQRMWLLFLDQLWYMVAGEPCSIKFTLVMSFLKALIFLCVRRGAQIPVDASEVFAQRAVVEFMLLNHNKELFTNENHSKSIFLFLQLHIFLQFFIYKIFNFVTGSLDISEQCHQGSLREDIHSFKIFRHLSGFRRWFQTIIIRKKETIFTK